jgi:transposase
MVSTLYLGIDVSMAENVCCALLPDGTEARRRFSVPNNLPGAETMVREILLLLKNTHLEHLLIGLESTNLYWWHLACFLHSYPQIAVYRPEIYAFNPRIVRGFKKAFPKKAKSDIYDAYIIADKLRFGRLPVPFLPDMLYQPLQRLTRFRYHIMHQIAREKSYFLSFLFLKFSEYQTQKPFSDVFGTASRAILTDFLSVDEVVNTPLEQLADLLTSEGRGAFPDPQDMALAIKKAAKDSYRVNANLNEPLNLILSTTLDNIRTLSSQTSKIDRAIERELQKFSNPLISIPGFGPVFTAGITAEIQNIHRFPDQSATAKFAGLTWQTAESGSFQAEETALDKSGNAYLRYYLIEAANSVRMHAAEYSNYYQTKFNESTKHKHKRALVLTARKLVRLVDAMLRRNQLYTAPDSNLFQEVIMASTRARPAKQHNYRLPGSPVITSYN